MIILYVEDEIKNIFEKIYLHFNRKNMKSKLYNLTSLLLDTNSKLVAEVRRRNRRIPFRLKAETLTKKHRNLFKLQKNLENDFEYKDVNISFWLDNKTQKRIAEYEIDSKLLANILSIMRTTSIVQDGQKNEIRKKVFEAIERTKEEDIKRKIKELF